MCYKNKKTVFTAIVRALYSCRSSRFLFDSLSFGFSFIRSAFAVIPNAMCNSSLARSGTSSPVPFVCSLVFRGYANDSLCAETSGRSLLPGILHASPLNCILNVRNFLSMGNFFFILRLQCPRFNRCESAPERRCTNTSSRRVNTTCDA